MSNNAYPAQVVLQINPVGEELHEFALAIVSTTGQLRSNQFMLEKLPELIAPLRQFATTPWRQYWAVGSLTPEIQYLGDFDSRNDAEDALNQSGYLRKEEMEVINSAQAAHLLLSARDLLDEPDSQET